jgi:hypothetical protein
MHTTAGTHLISVWVLHKRQRLAGLVCCAHVDQHYVCLVSRVVVHNHALHCAVILLDDVDTLANQAVRVCTGHRRMRGERVGRHEAMPRSEE